MKAASFPLTLSLICSISFGSAGSEMDSVSSVTEKLSNDSTQVELLLELSAKYREQNLPLSIQYAEQAINIYKGAPKAKNTDDLIALAELQSVRLKQSRLVTAGIITAASILLIVSWLFFRH